MNNLLPMPYCPAPANAGDRVLVQFEKVRIGCLSETRIAAYLTVEELKEVFCKELAESDKIELVGVVSVEELISADLGLAV